MQVTGIDDFDWLISIERTHASKSFWIVQPSNWQQRRRRGYIESFSQSPRTRQQNGNFPFGTLYDCEVVRTHHLCTEYKSLCVGAVLINLPILHSLTHLHNLGSNHDQFCWLPIIVEWWTGQGEMSERASERQTTARWMCQKYWMIRSHRIRMVVVNIDCIAQLHALSIDYHWAHWALLNMDTTNNMAQCPQDQAKLEMRKQNASIQQCGQARLLLRVRTCQLDHAP